MTRHFLSPSAEQVIKGSDVYYLGTGVCGVPLSHSPLLFIEQNYRGFDDLSERFAAGMEPELCAACVKRWPGIRHLYIDQPSEPMAKKTALKKTAPKKTAKPKAPAKEKVNPNKPVNGGSAFIVRFLDPKHEKTIDTYRSNGFLASKSTSGAVSELLDKIPAKLMELENATRERDELERVLLDYAYAVQDEVKAGDRATKALDVLLKASKRSSSAGARQMRLDRDY